MSDGPTPTLCAQDNHLSRAPSGELPSILLHPCQRCSQTPEASHSHSPPGHHHAAAVASRPAGRAGRRPPPPLPRLHSLRGQLHLCRADGHHLPVRHRLPRAQRHHLHRPPLPLQHHHPRGPPRRQQPPGHHCPHHGRPRQRHRPHPLPLPLRGQRRRPVGPPARIHRAAAGRARRHRPQRLRRLRHLPGDRHRQQDRRRQPHRRRPEALDPAPLQLRPGGQVRRVSLRSRRRRRGEHLGHRRHLRGVRVHAAAAQQDRRPQVPSSGSDSRRPAPCLQFIGQQHLCRSQSAEPPEWHLRAHGEGLHPVQLQFKHLPAKLRRGARQEWVPGSAVVQRRAEAWGNDGHWLRIIDVQLQRLFKQPITQHTDHSRQQPDSNSMPEGRISKVAVRGFHVEDVCYLIPRGVDRDLLPLILKTTALDGTYVFKRTRDSKYQICRSM